MGSPSPTRFSSARAPALKLSGDTDGAAGELRFRKAPGRGTVFVCAEQLWGSMPDRNHGNIETLRVFRGHAHGRWAI